LRQCGLDANGGMVGGTDHGYCLALQLRGAAEDVTYAFYGVFVAKQGLCQ
jgi:hypothetical protein